MKLFALIPSRIFTEARMKKGAHSFLAHCTIGENEHREMTLIVTVQDENGYAINGIQFVADLENINESQDASTREGEVDDQKTE